MTSCIMAAKLKVGHVPAIQNVACVDHVVFKSTVDSDGSILVCELYSIQQASGSRLAVYV